MANISGQIAIDAFVRRLLGKEGKDDDDYLRYMQITTDGIREMSIHDWNHVVTKVVTPDTTTNRFSFPTDFVRHVWIATVIDGRWWVYTKDDELAPLEDDDGTEIQSSLPNVAEFNIRESYGRAGGYNKYYFTIDRKNREFQVAGYTPDLVVLRYVSNGIDSAGSIHIPDYALKALEAYVRLNIADYDDHAESTIQRLQRQYDQHRRNMRKVNRPTLDEIKDALYSVSGSLMR